MTKMTTAQSYERARNLTPLQGAVKAVEVDSAIPILPAQVYAETDPGAPQGKRSWKFIDPETNTFVNLPINPNEMSSPTASRNITYAYGSRWGQDRIRAFDGGTERPVEWTFGGVVRTKEHYDLLLTWANKLKVLRVQDHLGRVFEVVITRYEPTERQPTATVPWRATYKMTCLLLKEVTA